MRPAPLLVASLLSLVAAQAWAQPVRPGKIVPGEETRTKPIEMDVLIPRAGLPVRGSLQGCNASGCTLANKTVRRDGIGWIGIGVNPSALPPAPPLDPKADAVQLATGDFQPGTLVGINATTVTTSRGAIPRGSVNWIYLAPPERRTGFAPGAAPPGTLPPPPLPPAASDPSDPTPPACPPSCPPPSGPPAGATGTNGAMWRGTIIGREVIENPGFSRSMHSFSAQLRGRERNEPNVINGVTVAEGFQIQSVDVSLMGAYESAELGLGGTQCSGSGRVTGDLSQHIASGMRKVAAVDLTPYFGFDLPTGAAQYSLELWPERSYAVNCKNPQAAWTQEESIPSVWIGRFPTSAISDDLRDPEVRFERGGRMQGSYDRALANGMTRLSVSWSICREGVECPPPTPLPDERAPAASTDPCPPPTPQQALLETALAQQKAMADALAAKLAQYRALAAQAAQYKSDYDQAARDCQLTQAAKMLTGFLLANPGVNVGSLPTFGSGAVPAEAMQALEQFTNFLNFLENVNAGSASWLLPDQSLNDFARIPNRFGGMLDPETIYDGVSNFLGFLDGYVGPSSPDSLLESLRACGGLTIDAVMDDAIRYLRLLQQVVPLMRDVQTRTNDLRAKDNEIFNLWANYGRECARYETCRGGTPAACEVWPPKPRP